MKKYLSSILIILAFFIEEVPQSSCITTYLGIELTEDISDVNCDNGTITDFQLSFHCDKKTLNRIVKKFNLTRDGKGIIINAKQYSWWNKSVIEELRIKYITKTVRNKHCSGPWMELFYDKKHSKIYIIRYWL